MDDLTRDGVMDDERERAARAQHWAVARTRLRRIVCALRDEASVLPEEALAAGSRRLAPLWQQAAQLPPAVTKAAMPSPEVRGQGPVRGRVSWSDRVLWAVELLAVLGVVVTLILSVRDLDRRQQGARLITPAGPVVWPTPAVRSVLPGETPTPTVTLAPGRAQASPTPYGTSTSTPHAVTVSPTASRLPMATAETSSRGEVPVPTITPGLTPVSPTGVRLVIPAIGVDAPVVEGDDWETLKTGIGHRVGSPWPGQAGNVVLSAHNDVHGAIFRDLRKLEPGDLVFAYTPEGVYRYEVLFTRLVLPTEVDVMDPTRQPVLTMITCYPPFMDTHRIVVTARLVD